MSQSSLSIDFMPPLWRRIPRMDLFGIVVAVIVAIPDKGQLALGTTIFVRHLQHVSLDALPSGSQVPCRRQALADLPIMNDRCQVVQGKPHRQEQRCGECHAAGCSSSKKPRGGNGTLDSTHYSMFSQSREPLRCGPHRTPHFLPAPFRHLTFIHIR
ncbi:hypothetical protein BC826DRAFT_1008881 [Russula brevipes]|nr:hypothetical protein BC826DRAFT_1008881 [Russula brevipes]